MKQQPVTFEIPLPPRACSPNEESSRHWRERSAGRAAYRNTAMVLCRRATGLLHEVVPKPVKISATFYCAPDPIRGIEQLYRPKDVANAIASIKAAVDGFVDAGLVPNDTAEWVDWGTVVIHRDKARHDGRRCVVITISPMEGTD